MAARGSSGSRARVATASRVRPPPPSWPPHWYCTSRRLLLCTGKVYYTLSAARQKDNRDDVAVVRVEQLYPFPQKELSSVLAKYRNVHEVFWVQEESKNRGAWTFMALKLQDLLPDKVVQYVGRDESASPATGSFKLHQIEEQELVTQALGVRPQTSGAVTQPGTVATAKEQTATSG